MCSRVVFVLLSASFLTVRLVQAGGSMAEDNKNNQTVSTWDAEWPLKVIKCFSQTRVLKCFLTLLDKKAKANALAEKAKQTPAASAGRAVPSSGNFTMGKLSSVLDVWGKVLSKHLERELVAVLKGPLFLNLGASRNRTSAGSNNTSSIQERKMKSNMGIKRLVPYMLVPGLMIAGIMPWVVPQIKMAIMMVGLMNQMAFSTALFSFVRGYIFDTTTKEHIFYINHGYANEKHNKYEEFKKPAALKTHR